VQGPRAPPDAVIDLYRTIMETLAAFVREQARWKEPKGVDKLDYLPPSVFSGTALRPRNHCTTVAPVAAPPVRRPPAEDAR
jgi:hypothetical protein